MEILYFNLLVWSNTLGLLYQISIIICLFVWINFGTAGYG